MMKEWGKLYAKHQAAGFNMTVLDSLIAATAVAQAHRRDLEHLGFSIRPADDQSMERMTASLHPRPSDNNPAMRISADQLAAEYDVVVVGGVINAATATLLKRKAPTPASSHHRESETFGRRVGEATVEVSGYFLGRVLGLTRFLNETQLAKQGLRFWFANENVKGSDRASEIGPKYLARILSFQIDRATVDEVLRRAVEGGIDLLRPAIVSRIDLHSAACSKSR
ncbi:MAG: hypothetical protein H7A50_13560 [Akkermansiaceae bacterium]|nr:hypothetical protein [Akkermansiaceae bacterium]